MGHFARAAANLYTLRKQISPDAWTKLRSGAFVLNTAPLKALTCSKHPLATQLVLNQLPFGRHAFHRRESHLGPSDPLIQCHLCGELEHASTLEMLFTCTEPAIRNWRAQMHPLIAPSPDATLVYHQHVLGVVPVPVDMAKEVAMRHKRSLNLLLQLAVRLSERTGPLMRQ